MGSIIAFMARTLYGKQLLSLVNAGNSALTGKRSEIIVGVIIAVSALEHLGLLPAKTTEPIIAALSGALPITLAEKVSNALDEANKVLPPPPAS